MSLAKALTVILEKNGYSADAVYDGRSALEYVKTGNYDGLILDVMMPHMDGLTVLKEIRREGNGIPILMLTAKAEVDDKVEGVDAGANDYLTKPFVAKELLARIRAMTRAPLSAADSKLSCGDLTLDRATKELSSKAGRLNLTNKEFQVMELLMCNPKQVISTERILEKIWGYDGNIEVNVVWVYLSYLRKKLVSLQSKVQIKASRNAGYSLEITDD